MFHGSGAMRNPRKIAEIRLEKNPRFYKNQGIFSFCFVQILSLCRHPLPSSDPSFSEVAPEDCLGVDT